MHEGVRHSLHDFLRRGSLLDEVDHSCDAAHMIILYDVRGPLANSFFTGRILFQFSPDIHLQDAILVAA
jgi:hypothetical protein